MHIINDEKDTIFRPSRPKIANSFNSKSLRSIPVDLGQKLPEEILETIYIITKKWHLKILYFLHFNPFVGFQELKKSIKKDISSNMLSKVLRELQDFGLIEKRIKNFSPYRVEYVSLISGEDFFDIIESIKKFGLKYIIQTK